MQAYATTPGWCLFLSDCSYMILYSFTWSNFQMWFLIIWERKVNSPVDRKVLQFNFLCSYTLHKIINLSFNLCYFLSSKIRFNYVTELYSGSVLGFIISLLLSLLFSASIFLCCFLFCLLVLMRSYYTSNSKIWLCKKTNKLRNLNAWQINYITNLKCIKLELFV